MSSIRLLPLTDTLSLAALPAFSDNYIWSLMDADQHAFWLIDPGDPKALQKALSEPLVSDGMPAGLSPSLPQEPAHPFKVDWQGWKLAGVLITHHHHDHVGGLDWLIEQYSSFPIIGPKHSQIPWVTETITEKTHLSMLGLDIEPFPVPGHTLDHLVYFIPSQARNGHQPLLFCGDTLFAGGCGRLFEGSPTEMRTSLQKIRQLPQHTWVCCAHEYTLANLAFAKALSPTNPWVLKRYNEVKKYRQCERCTLPSRLGQECLSNPFLRWDSQDIIESLRNPSLDLQHALKISSPFLKNEEKLDADSVFSVMRSWKNNF